MGGTSHKNEYKIDKTIGGWTEDEFEKYDWTIKLMFKDVHGETSLVEQVAIKINELLGYNNVDYIPEEEVLETAQEIIDLTVEHYKD